MTLRRVAQLTIATTMLAVGAASLAVPAQAAPAAATVPAVTVHRLGAAARGDDPLVAFAVKALDVWSQYRTSGDAKSLQQFRNVRDAVAVEAALRSEIDPARMKAAWANTDITHQLVLMTAFTQLGTPYRNRGTSPGEGFDCSGFTGWVWAQVGVQLPRISSDQIRNVTNVDRAGAQPGDLIYYPGHVSLYLGIDDAIVHSPFTGRDVEVSHISNRRSGSVRFGNPIG